MVTVIVRKSDKSGMITKSDPSGAPRPVASAGYASPSGSRELVLRLKLGNEWLASQLLSGPHTVQRSLKA